MEQSARIVLVDCLCNVFSAPWPVLLFPPSFFRHLEDMHFIISSILFGIFCFYYSYYAPLDSGAELACRPVSKNRYGDDRAYKICLTISSFLQPTSRSLWN
jgi:hypothetical protein